ncbi:MAG: FAD-dependent thymidylate synthase [Euryarchaeota archaeon]|nr:FAD-dependent thymidylate synthase [Euryarchaeota archaeon]
MKITLLSHTMDAEKLCAAAAQSCYSEKSATELLEEMERRQPGKIIEKVVGMGHHSVVEHACYTFSVEGVSRALTHQLVRHRIASYSQQSQRYVSLERPNYVVPPSIEKDPQAVEEFQRIMDDIWETYRRLSAKAEVEDARYVLPNACATNITITMNARELLHFFSLRCCNRAQWEIRAVADRMLAEVRKVSPSIFKDAGPPCVRGKCPEGSLSCGKPRKKELKRLK